MLQPRARKLGVMLFALMPAVEQPVVHTPPLEGETFADVQESFWQGWLGGLVGEDAGTNTDGSASTALPAVGEATDAGVPPPPEDAGTGDDAEAGAEDAGVDAGDGGDGGQDVDGGDGGGSEAGVELPDATIPLPRPVARSRYEVFGTGIGIGERSTGTGIGPGSTGDFMGPRSGTQGFGTGIGIGDQTGTEGFGTGDGIGADESTGKDGFGTGIGIGEGSGTQGFGTGQGIGERTGNQGFGTGIGIGRQSTDRDSDNGFWDRKKTDGGS